MDEDDVLLRRLREGDEGAFAALVRRHQPRLMTCACAIVGSRAVAEEVTQDTWLAVVRGLDRFEGRSSFKTWLYRILLNRAHTAASKEQRAGRPDPHLAECFGPDDHWCTPPVAWADQVEDRLDAAQLAARVMTLLGSLPEPQRRIVLLHDVERIASADISVLLGISDGHQRVLLHRGRTRLRAMLAAEMEAQQ